MAVTTQGGRGRSVLGRTLPSSIEAEKSVLSAVLLNDENLSLISDILDSSDFHHRSHKIIYQAIIDVAQENKKIDIIVLQDALASKKQLESIGGIGYLLALQEDIPALGLIEQHAKIIKEKSLLRNLIHSSTDIISSCYDKQDHNIDELLDSAEKQIFQVSNKLSLPSFVPINVVLKQTFHNLANIKAAQEGVTGIPTGYTQFDTMTSGMQKGDLLILAARPSMGKTALALNMATNAWKEGASIGMFSLEMSSEQLVLRLLSSESGIPHQRIRNAMISSDEWMELTDTAAKLADAKIFIDDTASLSILELKAKARKLKAAEDIQFLVIDYLQLLSGGQHRYENRTQEISAISRALKALAKELNIPVLALSQLSRSLENRMDKRPLLSDLRESGAIEQDGDVIFFIYRDVVYNSDTEQPDLAELIIGKQRNGPVGTTYIKFNGELTRFENLDDTEAHH